MRRTTLILAVLAVSAAAAIAPSRVHAATPQQVDAAIRKAISFLYSQQKKGNWEVVPRPDPGGNHVSIKTGQWGGLTGIATCALLYAGENPQDPRMKQAIEWLVNAPMVGIYAMGFRCQVWAMIPPNPEIVKVAHRDRDYLLSAVWTTDDQNFGFYPYYFLNGVRGGDGGHWYDHSISQYGVLGMWAISQLNVEIPAKYWQMTETAWRRHQYPSGAWSYQYKAEKDRGQETLAMTAAGVASLFITQEMLHGDAGLRCEGNYKDEALERGLAWISKNFEDYKKHHPHYALYGCERIGVAAGYKYFGKLNWYEEGAEYLVKGQNGDGSWGGHEDNHNHNKVPNTCFALMFLARGRAPVMMNKLDYRTNQAGDKEREPTWNERPRDVANIVRWTGRQRERDLNWQIVNLRAPVDELHDAPILYVSGRDALNLTKEEEAKLRQFVEQGGLILGHADCANKSFSESFKKLGQKLFSSYEFRELPPTHPIYGNQQFRRKDWPDGPFLLGLSNGVRELMLLFPTADPGRGWQTRAFAGPQREPLAQIMANIFFYAVDKQFRYKGESYLVKADPKKQSKHKIKIARIEHQGNWDPEPAGWRRMDTLMHNRRETDLTVESLKLGAGKLTGGGYQLAHVTGTSKFKLSEKEREELKKFVDGGGTVLFDAAGGSADFAMSAQDEVNTLLGAGKQAALLPAGHAIYSAGGKGIGEVDYRQYARKVLGSRSTPMMAGAEVGGRVRVLFSAEDLSAGMTGQPVDGVHGYDPKSATDIMERVLLYAAGREKAEKADAPEKKDNPAPKPAAKPAPAKKK